MEMLKKVGLFLGVAANAMILAFILTAAPVEADGVDDCDEEEVSACVCLPAGTWWPDGCYDNDGGSTDDCVSGADCEFGPT